MDIDIKTVIFVLRLDIIWIILCTTKVLRMYNVHHNIL